MKVLIVSARPAWASVFGEYLKLRYGEVLVVHPASFSLRADPPEVLVVDCVHLPGAFAVTAKASTAWPQSRLVALVSRPSDLVARCAREAGCHAVISEADDLVGWGAVLNRLHHLPFQSGESFRNAPAFLPFLTRRQLEAYFHVARGATDEELAAELGVSTVTAETHRRDLQVKLGCTSHHDVCAHAIRHGIIDPGDVRGGPAQRRATRPHSG